MKNRRSFNPIIYSAMFVCLYALAGCGMSTTTSSGDSADSRRAGVWNTSGFPVDAGSNFDVTPQLAVQPNGGGGAMAVWIRRVPPNPGDIHPGVYHLYARHFTNGVPDGTDIGCPFGNPDATGNEGDCLIDTGSAEFDAWSPKVSMDSNGDAVVVWQQHDGTAQRVYARRYTAASGGSWGPYQQLNDSIEFASFDAGDPTIALEPDPTNNGGTDDAAGSAMAAWSQYNEKDWVQVFNSSSTLAIPPQSPATASGTNWATPNNVFTSNNAYAVYNNTSQDDLCVTNFSIVVPGTATTILGIIVSVEGNGTSATATDRQYRIGLTKAGCVLDGARKTGIQMNQTTDTVTPTGNLNDLWGSTWTPADIQAATFGVLISDNDTTAAPLNIDTITVTIITDLNAQCSVAGNCSQVRTMVGVYNNQLFAGMGGTLRGSSDIFVYDNGTNSWTYSFNDDDPVNGYEMVESMAVYNSNLYTGLGGGTNSFEGDLRVFDGTTWTTLTTNNLSCGGGSPLCSNVGGAAFYDAVRSMAVYQCSTCLTPSLYIGMGIGNGVTGAGDVWRCTTCDGTDWQMVWDSTNNPSANYYGTVNAMEVYNGRLYIGLGSINSTATADVKRCSICDGTDWTTVLNNSSTYRSVRSMAIYNGQLYVGYGDDGVAIPGNGDIQRCTLCDGTDWSGLVFDGGSYPENYEGVNAMTFFNGFLYIGLGNPGTSTATPGDGDIKRCRVCDGSDWSAIYNDVGTYDSVHSLAVYSGELYAGFGNNASQDGDIWRFTAGWQTVARRLVNGIWDTTDTICPAGSGVDDGICYVSGVLGASIQPTQSPRVKVDNFGRAITAFVQMIQQSDCFVPPTATPPPDNNIVIVTANCMVSTIEANLYDGTIWQSPIDLHPDANLSSGTPGSVASTRQLICFESSNGPPVTRGTISNSDSCVNLLEFDLTMDATGQTFLLIKTSWGLSEDFGTDPDPIFGGCNNQHTAGTCSPDENAFENYMGQAIVAREYGMASPWSAANWTLSRLANFGYEGGTGTNFGVALGPFPAGCPSRTTIDGGRVVLNCLFRNPRIAIEPDGGGTALAVYESYNGTTFNINGQHFDGATWAGSTTIDAGGGDAHAPQIAMDAPGNGVSVWTQNDGTKFRIFSNCYANSTAPPNTCGASVTGWQGPPPPVDGDVEFQSGYFSPVIGLNADGGAGSALSLFLGWSILDNTTRLYSATGP
jgi:hypothetical protein